MATNGHSGHPMKWFKDQNLARNSFECAICLEILKDPVQVRDCGHQFCALCIDDILKTDPRCPACRMELSDTKIFEDHAARRLIKQLEVNCCNEGCSWQGTLSSLLEDHQNKCSFLIRSGDNVHELDVGKLEQKLESLMLKVSSLEKKHETQEQDIKQLKLKVNLHDEDVRALRQEIFMLRAVGPAPLGARQPLSLQEPEPTYTWKIANFTTKLARAKSDYECGDIESEPFFSSHGYKMKVSVHLNEGPRGDTGYMGVYISLMKSDRDGTLSWPFTNAYKLVLIDQQDDLSTRQDVELIQVPSGEKQFKRPRRRENAGWGVSRFVEHSTLRTRQYVKDHNVYIKVFIYP